jgi:hypothetical protein
MRNEVSDEIRRIANAENFSLFLQTNAIPYTLKTPKLMSKISVSFCMGVKRGLML